MYWKIELYSFHSCVQLITMSYMAYIRYITDLFVSVVDGIHAGLLFIKISRNQTFRGPLRKGSRATRCTPLSTVIL
jgi:hypothetical protein